MKFRHVIFGGLLVIIPLAVAEGLSALYLRVLAPNARPLSERNRQMHVYEPYRGHALTPSWSAGGDIHDAQGFRRSTDVTREKPPNTVRIFLMGGSAAYGAPSLPPFPPVSISNEQTIDSKLETLLRARLPGQHVEVINAAVTAYWTHQHLIYLLETLLDYDPDLVILLDGINDHYHTRLDHNQFLSYEYSLPLRVGALNQPSLNEVLRVSFSWAKQYSYAAFLLNDGLGRALGWNATPEDPCQREVVPPDGLNAQFAEQYDSVSRRSWVRLLRTVLMVLRDNGVRVIVADQPELIFDQTSGRSPADMQLLAIERNWRPAYYKEKKEFLKPHAQRLAAETAGEFGARYVDLTDVFDDQAPYFIDYCHLSEAGAQKVAEQLAPVVMQVLSVQGATDRKLS